MYLTLKTASLPRKSGLIYRCNIFLPMILILLDGDLTGSRENIPPVLLDASRRAPEPEIHIPLPNLEPGLGLQWQLNWNMTDHFQKDKLNLKWETTDELWLGRAPSFFRPENVIRDTRNQCVHLQVRADQPTKVSDHILHDRIISWNHAALSRNVPEDVYRDYSAAWMRTKHAQRYGYFEAYVHLARSELSSAFWLKRTIHESWDTEIDVFEFSTSTKNGTDQSKIINTNHHLLKDANGTSLEPSKNVEIHNDFDLSKCPHKFAVDWTKDYIRWYFDGKLIREVVDHPYHIPMHVLFDRETFPEWFGLPDPSSITAQDLFTVYYVRSWIRKSLNTSQ